MRLANLTMLAALAMLAAATGCSSKACGGVASCYGDKLAQCQNIPGLHGDARVHPESHPRLGLRGGAHAGRLPVRCPVLPLYLGERQVQRSLQCGDGYDDLPEHPSVPLVGL